MATIEEVYEKVTELHQAGAPDEDIDKFIVAEGFKFEDIQNYKPRPKDLDVTTGADYNVRLAAGLAPNFESKLATVQKFHPDARKDAETNNIIFGESTGNPMLFNPEGMDMGDIVQYVTKPAFQVTGSALGAVGGSVAGPGGTLVGAGGGMAAGSEVAERMGQLLFGTEIIRDPKEYGIDRSIDLVAGTGGQALGPIISGSIKSIIRGTGAKAERARKRLATYLASGTSPSMYQMSTNPVQKYIEILLGNIPGGSGVMATFGKKAQDNIGKYVGYIADRLSKKTYPIDNIKAGSVLKEGISGFRNRFMNEAETLYTKADELIGLDTNVTSIVKDGNFVSTLNKLVTETEKGGFKETTKALSDDFILSLQTAINKDLAEGGTYAGLKQIRTKIGKKISGMSLIPDANLGELKMLYKALSQDMVSIAKSSGDDALKAMNNANKYYDAGIKRLTNVLSKIVGQTSKADETVSKYLFSSTKEGPTYISTALKSLKPDERRLVISNMINKMGTATPATRLAVEGVEEGSESIGQFSTETFLTNWNKMDLKTKTALMSNIKIDGKPLSSYIDTIAKVSSYIRESGKMFANPSGTSDRLIGQALIMGGAAGALTASGNAQYIWGLFMAAVGAYGGAKIFTNPSFVKWAASTTNIAAKGKVDKLLQQFTKLGPVYAANDPEFQEFVTKWLNTMTKPKKKISNGNSKNNNINVTVPLPATQ